MALKQHRSRWCHERATVHSCRCWCWQRHAATAQPEGAIAVGGMLTVFSAGRQCRRRCQMQQLCCRVREGIARVRPASSWELGLQGRQLYTELLNPKIGQAVGSGMQGVTGATGRGGEWGWDSLCRQPVPPAILSPSSHPSHCSGLWSPPPPSCSTTRSQTHQPDTSASQTK